MRRAETTAVSPATIYAVHICGADRVLFGRVGKGMSAGSIANLVMADRKADPDVVATDPMGQVEHADSARVWR